MDLIFNGLMHNITSTITRSVNLFNDLLLFVLVLFQLLGCLFLNGMYK